MINYGCLNQPEIAAPAGNLEMLTAAVRCGADAVYLGLKKFSARAFANNFSKDDLHLATGYCHARGVRIFVAINTLVYNEELTELKQAITEIAECGVDAVIVQDMAALYLAKKLCPDIAIHASTQCSTLTADGVRFLGDSGFKRVVIGREAGIEEVTAAVNTGVEIEMFVHGALCYSLSGGCYMSAFLGGRSANRGRCASPCRLPYNGGSSLLSLRDLSLLDNLPELKAAGVCSVKIEGRMRTPEYVAAAVDATVKARQGESYDENTLMNAFSHGGFTKGYYNGSQDPQIFGARTERDHTLTKAVLPKLHSLYRTERQSVPISLTLTLSDNLLTLGINCGQDYIEDTIEVVTEPTEKDQENALKNALLKLGGTPFYADNVALNLQPQLFVPSSAVSSLRKELIQKLLSRREKIVPHNINSYELPLFEPVKRADRASLRIRISNPNSLSELSQSTLNRIEYIILPVEFCEILQKELVDKAIVEYSRGCSDKERARLYKKATALGYTRHIIDNPSHFALRGELYGGFGLNITNRLSMDFYLSQGLKDITLSPEISAAATRGFGYGVGVIGYGHIPLMMSAALPDCDINKGITDRKQKIIRVTERQGFVELLNPIPLYIGDRQDEFKVDFFTLHFTDEPPKRVLEVINMFLEERGYDGEYTRGLYY